MHDTQCGFKLIEGKLARALAVEMRIDGFAFDIELLARAARRGAACIEVPVRWAHVEASRVQPVRHSLQMARDVLRLRWWLWVGRLEFMTWHRVTSVVAYLRADDHAGSWGRALATVL